MNISSRLFQSLFILYYLRPYFRPSFHCSIQPISYARHTPFISCTLFSGSRFCYHYHHIDAPISNDTPEFVSEDADYCCFAIAPSPSSYISEVDKMQSGREYFRNHFDSLRAFILYISSPPPPECWFIRVAAASAQCRMI